MWTLVALVLVFVVSLVALHHRVTRNRLDYVLTVIVVWSGLAVVSAPLGPLVRVLVGGVR